MAGNINTLWQTATDLLKGEMSDLSFRTWIQPLIPLQIKNNTFYIQTIDENHIGFLGRYTELIKNAINSNGIFTYDLKLVSNENSIPAEEKPEEITSSENCVEAGSFKSLLNPRYTFDTFVIGSSNRFAHAAAVAVTENPAKAYNPLFIYGGSGLGKTHLLTAIGLQILENNPNSKVLYVSSEKFTNDLINSIKDDKNAEFRELYRNTDVLIIDDIQFIGGKERTQEEFFHTFNDLYEAHKQIIISSDRPPNEITTLEERLRSRFAWGIIADISKPDLETKIAILKKKADSEGINIPDDVLLFIANNVVSSIRELEGALNRLIAYCSLTENLITIDVAEQTLGDLLLRAKNKTVTCDVIINAVSRYFDVRIEEIKAKKKHKEIAYPRQIAMFLCRDLTENSLPKIGSEFGRDHTTIMHAIEKIKEDLITKEETKKAVEEIKTHILGI